MPSPRKRIGFLPGVEVQEIIDNICMEKGLSQSKVTGILVEEALKSRGLYEPKLDKKEFIDKLTKVIFSEKFNSEEDNLFVSKEKDSFSKEDFRIENQNNDVVYTKKEFEILKDYLEFKRFKYMLIKAKEEDVG